MFLIKSREKHSFTINSLRIVLSIRECTFTVGDGRGNFLFKICYVLHIMIWPLHNCSALSLVDYFPLILLLLVTLSQMPPRFFRLHSDEMRFFCQVWPLFVVEECLNWHIFIFFQVRISEIEIKLMAKNRTVFKLFFKFWKIFRLKTKKRHQWLSM